MPLGLFAVTHASYMEGRVEKQVEYIQSLSLSLGEEGGEEEVVVVMVEGVLRTPFESPD